MQVSSELASQTMGKYIISRVLDKKGRTKWMDNYNVHDLSVEAWGVGVWIKQAGIISYKDLADLLKEEAEMKAWQLPVEKVARGYLVKSFQCSDRYFITFTKQTGWQCGCMRYRCWRNRMQEELPQLLNQFNGKVFCHHIVAAYKSL
ncbi:MAG: hypothetical protein PUP91_28385 [Rhizonema sp. PD37]|nr:hypothetical protein [Rhizonema sp. PD37]